MARVRGREASVKLSVKGNGNRVSITVHGRGNGEARRNKGLVFRKGNAKLRGIHTFSLPAGWSCPFAQECRSKADPETGSITDGPSTEFRCFAASQEAFYPSVRNARWWNFNLLRRKTREEMTALILQALTKPLDEPEKWPSSEVLSEPRSMAGSLSFRRPAAHTAEALLAGWRLSGYIKTFLYPLRSSHPAVSDPRM